MMGCIRDECGALKLVLLDELHKLERVVSFAVCSDDIRCCVILPFDLDLFFEYIR